MVELKKHKVVRRHLESKNIKQEQKVPQIREDLKVAALEFISAAGRILNGLLDTYDSLFMSPPQTKVNLNKEQGFKFFDKRDYEKAKDFFLSYIEEGNEKDVNILCMIAMCHKNTEEYRQAIEYLKRADNLKKDDPRVIMELGDSFFCIEEYSEAIVFLKKASAINPDEADIYYHLGICFEKTGQIEEAKKCYKKAIDLEPRESVYYQALGVVHESCGNHKDAIMWFKKTMEVEKFRKRRGERPVKRAVSYK